VPKRRILASYRVSPSVIPAAEALVKPGFQQANVWSSSALPHASAHISSCVTSANVRHFREREKGIGHHQVRSACVTGYEHKQNQNFPYVAWSVRTTNGLATGRKLHCSENEP